MAVVANLINPTPFDVKIAYEKGVYINVPADGEVNLSIDIAELHPPVAVDDVLHLLENTSRNRVLRARYEKRLDLFRAEPRRRGIPEGEGRDFVDVHVARALLELGEPHQAIAHLLEARMLNLEKDRAVPLDNQGL